MLGGWDVEQALLNGVSLVDDVDDVDGDDDGDQAVLNGVSLVSPNDNGDIMVTTPFSS